MLSVKLEVDQYQPHRVGILSDCPLSVGSPNAVPIAILSQSGSSVGAIEPPEGLKLGDVRGEVVGSLNR
jgi:hypothetical protein